MPSSLSASESASGSVTQQNVVRARSRSIAPRFARLLGQRGDQAIGGFRDGRRARTARESAGAPACSASRTSAIAATVCGDDEQPQGVTGRRGVDDDDVVVSAVPFVSLCSPRRAISRIPASSSIPGNGRSSSASTSARDRARCRARATSPSAAPVLADPAREGARRVELGRR